MSYLPLLITIIDEENEERERENRRQGQLLRLKRIALRNTSNAMSIPEERFKELFRVNKAMFLYILEKVTPAMKCSQRNSFISINLKVLAALRFYATGSYQRSVGSDFFLAVSQTSVSRIIDEVSTAIENNLCQEWIKFPNANEFNAIKARFYAKTGFPGVIGAVDGTHVTLLQPTADEHLYLNRRGKHSINTQIICDYDLKIFAVNARHPGATHDAAIWQLCYEREYLQQIWHQDSHLYLLGDSGYPLEPWLMTPYRNAQEGTQQLKYNKKHTQARNCVERCIGALKARFRCLGGDRIIRYTPQKTCRIINVCCALHNLCKHFNVELQEEIIPASSSNDMDDNFNFDSTPNSRRLEAERLRTSISNSFRN